MRHIDQQYGLPDVPFSDTAANLSSIGVVEGQIGYATDTHKFGFYNGTSWVYPVAGFLFSGGGASQELALPNAKITLSGGGASCQLTLPNLALSLAGATGKTLTLTNSLTSQGGFDGILSWSAAVTLTIAAAASVAGTFSASGRTLTVQTGDVKLTGAGSTTELSLPNAKITFAGGGASCQLTLPNIALSLAGATGKTLTLTNSLTNQGGNDGILSWSGAFTLTIPATGSVALLGTANVFTALQTASISDAATNTIVNPLNVTHNSSSGSVAATFGVREYHNLKSTTTADTNAFSIETQWVVATHASRTARTTFTTIDFGATREVIRIEGSGTAALLGFFAVTAVARVSAYTQTYSTASKTVSALTMATMTEAYGTADNTLADVGTSFNQTTLNNNFQDCVTQINKIIADHTVLIKVVTAIIDDLQAYGLFQ